MRATCLFVFLLLIACPAIPAQAPSTPNTLKLDPKAESPKAVIADMAWLAGAWRGEGLGGVCEEIWSPPLAGSMIGMFRLVKADKLAFSEFMTIAEENGSLLLKIRHFDPQFKGWEEKDQFVRFPLVKMGTNEAYFSGLTIRKNSDGGLRIYLAMKLKGEVKEEEFVFRPSAAK
ncbi:MAG: DUF6265 family protein [Gemmataceae bacterium]|nr:DUF6265 family protein [Gemmataceae bacterium]MCI0741133.1 DUF6265 family protein [Gemmataceae bacterium]